LSFQQTNIMSIPPISKFFVKTIRVGLNSKYHRRVTITIHELHGATASSYIQVTDSPPLEIRSRLIELKTNA
jgi:hypothetical protein